MLQAMCHRHSHRSLNRIPRHTEPPRRLRDRQRLRPGRQKRHQTLAQLPIRQRPAQRFRPDAASPAHNPARTILQARGYPLQRDVLPPPSCPRIMHLLRPASATATTHSSVLSWNNLRYQPPPSAPSSTGDFSVPASAAKSTRQASVFVTALGIPSSEHVSITISGACLYLIPPKPPLRKEQEPENSFAKPIRIESSAWGSFLDR